MNLILGDAVEISVKKGTRTDLGRILLKGDAITLITAAPLSEEEQAERQMAADN